MICNWEGFGQPAPEGRGWAETRGRCSETRDTHAACPAPVSRRLSANHTGSHARRPRIKRCTARTKLLGPACAARRTARMPNTALGTVHWRTETNVCLRNARFHRADRIPFTDFTGCLEATAYNFRYIDHGRSIRILLQHPTGSAALAIVSTSRGNP